MNDFIPIFLLLGFFVVSFAVRKWVDDNGRLIIASFMAGVFLTLFLSNEHSDEKYPYLLFGLLAIGIGVHTLRMQNMARRDSQV